MLESFQARLATPFAVLGIRTVGESLTDIQYLPQGAASFSATATGYTAATQTALLSCTAPGTVTMALEKQMWGDEFGMCDEERARAGSSGERPRGAARGRARWCRGPPSCR